MKRWATSLLLAGAMLVPVAAVRADDDRDDHNRERAYRQEQHHWTKAEEKAYRQYLKEQRMQYRSWNRANEAQRQAYWNWRDRHPEFDRHTR
jgi:hypothetical protein